MHFYIALGILKLKKYPKSPGTHATLHIFFKKRIFFRKFFLAKKHREGPKWIFRKKKIFPKIFFWKTLRKISQIFFFDQYKKNFFLSFLVIFKKKISCLEVILGQFQWDLAKKFFFEKQSQTNEQTNKQNDVGT